MARIAVIGIGNVLTGDDAIGPTVVRTLEAAFELPDDVQVIDGGTPGLDLTAYMVGLDGLVLVDALRAKGTAGEVRVYDKAGILNKGPIVAMSPHEPGLRESLLHAEFQGVTPPVVKLVGVVAGSTEFGVFLTPEVRAAVPVAVARLVEELAALGAAPAARATPATPDLWWERPQPA